MSKSDYTDELGAELRRQYERGVSPAVLAELYGIGASTARTWLIRAGTEMRPAVKPRKTPAPAPEHTQSTGTIMRSTFTPTRPLPVSSKRGLPKAIRTTCKLCLRGIRDGDATEWRTSAPLGLVHQECPA